MNSLETLNNIVNCSLASCNKLQYCLVDKNKVPYRTNGEKARPNHKEDFVSLDDLVCDNLTNFAGIGISIQASDVCAIDVDDCFTKPFNVESADNRAKKLLELFNDYYVEFSFSGKGLRILFDKIVIEDYTKNYYIKNSKKKMEFYQPNSSFRYVTITGKTIKNNCIKIVDSKLILSFLDTYMLKDKNVVQSQEKLAENKDYDKCLKMVKGHLLTNLQFQNNWFNKAPGSGSNESERDWSLIRYLYEHITTDRETIRKLFEESEFYKSKDEKHKHKWNYNNHRYFNYVYDRIGETK